MDPRAVFLFRLYMTILLSFEILNWAGVWGILPVYTWHGLVGVGISVWIVVEMVFFRKRQAPGVSLAVFLVALALLLDFLGDVAHLYAAIRGYDKILHWFNSGVIVYGIFVVFREKFESFGSGWFYWTALVALGCLFGTLYEIEEYLEDMFMNGRSLRLGDGPDTAGDLLANILGCLTVTLLVAFHKRPKKKCFRYINATIWENGERFRPQEGMPE